jgi:hypothetical protein
LIKWEYRCVAVTDDLGSDLTSLGADGWELSAIYNGLAWLKRDRVAHAFKQQAEQHAAERGAK